jgi:molybdopterin-guanine dinucleotide biosynthesis protein B
MRVLGITGWSGSGKTTLVVALLPRLILAGLSVSTIKHAHHGFDLDQPGKDSWRHRQAGASEVLICGGHRWALMHEEREGEPELSALLERLAPVDLVLIEGFKADPHPKLEVHRPALGKPPIWPGRQDIVAVATDAASVECDRPLLPLDDLDAIAAFVLAFVRGEAPLSGGAGGGTLHP